MTAPLYSNADYTAAIQALLPRGFVWPRDSDATLTLVAKALSGAANRLNLRANQLLVDAFPATAVELLPEWEEALGIPGPFGVVAPTIAGQQSQVVTALTNTGGQSIEFFEALILATFGVVATITQYARFTVRLPVGSPIAGDGWAHSWSVDSAVSGMTDVVALEANIQALVTQLSPAHTIVAFTFH